MESLSIFLLLLYFLSVIVKMIIGRLFLSELKTSKNDLWVLWDKPKSVFSPKKENWKLYKYVFFTRREEFGNEVKLYWLSKSFASIIVLSQITFIGFIVMFVVVGFSRVN